MLTAMELRQRGSRRGGGGLNAWFSRTAIVVQIGTARTRAENLEERYFTVIK
jgi:hypothetical protein